MNGRIWWQGRPFSKLGVVEVLWRNLGVRRKLRKRGAWLLVKWRDLWDWRERLIDGNGRW
jgi:hypothetical protein